MKLSLTDACEAMSGLLVAYGGALVGARNARRGAMNAREKAAADGDPDQDARVRRLDVTAACVATVAACVGEEAGVAQDVFARVVRRCPAANDPTFDPRAA